MIDLSESYNLDLFKKLVKIRSRMVLGLSIFSILALGGNLYLMSSGANIGAKKIAPDSAMTIVIAYSFALVVLGAFIAGFYVWWANRKLDPLMEQVRQDIMSQPEGK